MNELRKLSDIRNHIGYLNQEVERLCGEMERKINRIEAKIPLELPLTKEEKQYYFFVTGKKI